MIRNTVIFSLLTGLSRVAGLLREVVAAGIYGTTGAASAFAIAFQVPNLVRALVADAALSAAFVPVFSDLLEHKRRREATQLAGALAGLILLGLGALTVTFIVVAPLVMPLFTGEAFSPTLDALTIGLSRLLFPIVILLALNGLVVGILNTHDHFSIPALAPLVWNAVIVAALFGLTPLFRGDDRLYAYAVGVLLGTAIQLGMCVPQLRRLGVPIRSLTLPSFRDPRIRRVLGLMLPVSVGLGLINVGVVLNSVLGSLVSPDAPRAIDAAFRLYTLPQGMFSVAVTTVLYPLLARLAHRRDFAALRAAAATGMRQIALLLIPSAAVIVALATPITRLVYERGQFDAESTRQVAKALFWFSFALPLGGLNLLLTRTFFALQRPWLPTRLALGSLLLNTTVSLMLFKPLGISGIIIGTVMASAAMVIAQAARLRRELDGMELGRTLGALALMLTAATILASVAWLTWTSFDLVFGRSLVGQLASVGAAILAGGATYAQIVLRCGLPEAQQIAYGVRRRLAMAGRPATTKT